MEKFLLILFSAMLSFPLLALLLLLLLVVVHPRLVKLQLSPHRLSRLCLTTLQQV